MALHVDYEIRWKNFRSFRDTQWIQLKPLTILIGPNNSGKTSILAPIILLNQTMNSRDRITPLVTRGQLIDAGTFKDLIYGHDTTRELFFGFRFHVHEPREQIGPVGEYPPGVIQVTLKAGDQPQDLRLMRYELFDIYGRPLLSRSRHRSGTYTLSGLRLDNMTSQERDAVRSSRPVNFLFSPTSALHAYHLEEDDEQEKDVDFSAEFSQYLRSVGFTYEELGRIFVTLSYIGPLRDRPRRYYEVAGEIPRSVGPRGENTANLLYRNFDTLKQRLDRWVRSFEFGERLELHNMSEDLFSLTFNTGSKQTNIADAGFGASQVLPLVIQALAAPRNSMTLAEQPEIHLNPRLQVVLADLFVEMANEDHRVVVETHSEHLLLRVRRLVAGGAISPEKVAVYFVERRGDTSYIRQIPLREDGHIDSDLWPAGFFEDALRESLGLATVQATRQLQNGPEKNAS